MPDEDSIQNGVVQTSQNNQTEKQSENDFVLDFGDEEETENVNMPEEGETNETSDDEINNTESVVNSETEGDLDFGQDLFGSSENGEELSESSNEPEKQDTVNDEENNNETISNNNENESDEDFSLSFDTDTNSDNAEQNISTEENNSETDFLPSGSQTELDDNKENNDLLIPDDTPISVEENSDMNEENINEIGVLDNKQDEENLQQDITSVNNELDYPVKDESDGANTELQQDETQPTNSDTDSASDIFLQDDKPVENITLNDNQLNQSNVELSSTEETSQSLIDNTDTGNIDFSYNDSQSTGGETVNNDTVEEKLRNESENNDGGILFDINKPDLQDENPQNSNNAEPNMSASENDMAITNVSSEQSMETTPSNVDNIQPSVPSDFNIVPNNDSNQTELANNSTEVNQQQREGVEIKSTLSLDQILDSELMSNPQFAGTSKAIPNNEPIKQSGGRGKFIGVAAGILIFLLAGFVVTLAFPSLGINRHFLDGGKEIVTPDEPIVQDEDQIGDDTLGTEQPEIEDETRAFGFVDDIDGDPHGTPPSEFLDEDDDEVSDGGGEDEMLWEDVPDEGEDSEGEDTQRIDPYVFVDDYTEESEENKELSADTILSNISAFKLQGDNYYAMGIEDSNKKIIKYASYIQYLCDEYQSKVESGEGLDENSWNDFESEVEKFIAKISNELGGADEDIEIVYAHADFVDINDEEKNAMREYLTTR